MLHFKITKEFEIVASRVHFSLNYFKFLVWFNRFNEGKTFNVVSLDLKNHKISMRKVLKSCKLNKLKDAVSLLIEKSF